MSAATPDIDRAPARVQAGLIDPKMFLTSIPDAVRKLDPRVMVHSPVMFVVEVGALGCTVLAIKAPTTFAW
jgi:K+-transporting ATPase ATPase B chain